MNDYTRSIRSEIDGPVRHYEYENEAVIVADFGVVDGSVDVVDGTAIVVISDEHFELSVAGGTCRAGITMRIVSIEGER